MQSLLDQFRFNITIRILITIYGASCIGNFAAFVPGCNKDDTKLLKCNSKSNYSARLISSLLFFLFGISQFRYANLVYLTMGEMYLTIFSYLILVIKKRHYLKQNRDKAKEVAKNKLRLSSPNKQN